MQVTALEKIASHRKAGVLRSDMAKAVDMDPKSFHYIATVRVTRKHQSSPDNMGRSIPCHKIGDDSLDCISLQTGSLRHIRAGCSNTKHHRNLYSGSLTTVISRCSPAALYCLQALRQEGLQERRRGPPTAPTNFHLPCVQALEARGLIGSVQEMVQGPMAGPKLTMTSRLFLRRFLPRVVVQIEADVEAQQVLEALAACPNQTAVESDMKVAPMRQ